jgi:RNA polymerase sigma factor (sigma-70 family)
MPFSPESDVALVMRLLPETNGNDGERNLAWGEVDVRYRDQLSWFIRQWITSEAEAEEIYQDTLITAFMNVENGRYTYTGVPFAAYLKAIARNKMLAERRRTSRWVELDEDIPSLDENTGSRPEACIESREEWEGMMSAIDELPNKMRRVILGVLDGKENDELAEEFDTTEEAIRQHKSRGIRSLQQKVA